MSTQTQRERVYPKSIVHNQYLFFMKKLNFIRKGILLLTLFILTSHLNAQLTFTQAMDNVLAPLDKGKIPTGILYDRIKPIANIDLFNVPSGDPYVSDYSYFKQAY